MHDIDSATPAAIRREDYRPPAFLVDSVDLMLAGRISEVNSQLRYYDDAGRMVVKFETPRAAQQAGMSQNSRGTEYAARDYSSSHPVDLLAIGRSPDFGPK